MFLQPCFQPLSIFLLSVYLSYPLQQLVLLATADQLSLVAYFVSFAKFCIPAKFCSLTMNNITVSKNAPQTEHSRLYNRFLFLSSRCILFMLNNNVL